MAAEAALAADLQIATSQQQAEQLLQQTAEAQVANLSLGGTFDLRGLMGAAVAGRMLHPIHLDGVASTLEVPPIPAILSFGRCNCLRAAHDINSKFVNALVQQMHTHLFAICDVVRHF